MPEREIVVRRIQFEYPDSLSAHWHPQRPELSQLINACSLLMPYLEPYLIESVREAIPQLPSEALQRDARGYIGQEANHFRQHRRFNDLILQQGYAELAAYERTLQADYDRFRAQRDLRFRLGYAAGFETMALAIGHMLVAHREFFFGDADPAVSSLVLWHFVEELEHKNAAFDVYQACFGASLRGYLYRAWSFLFAVGHTVGRSAQAYMALRRIDQRRGLPGSRLRGWFTVARIACWATPRLLHGLLPWHRPRAVPDPVWVDQWLALYDRDQGGVALLDTRRLQGEPQALAPSG